MQTVYNVHIRCDTHTSCRVFDRGAVATCLKDKDLSRPGIKPRSLVWEANALQLRYGGGEYVINGYRIYLLVLLISGHI